MYVTPVIALAAALLVGCSGTTTTVPNTDRDEVLFSELREENSPLVNEVDHHTLTELGHVVCDGLDKDSKVEMTRTMVEAGSASAIQRSSLTRRSRLTVRNIWHR